MIQPIIEFKTVSEGRTGKDVRKVAVSYRFREAAVGEVLSHENLRCAQHVSRAHVCVCVCIHALWIRMRRGR